MSTVRLKAVAALIAVVTAWATRSKANKRRISFVAGRHPLLAKLTRLCALMRFAWFIASGLDTLITWTVANRIGKLGMRLFSALTGAPFLERGPCAPVEMLMTLVSRSCTTDCFRRTIKLTSLCTIVKLSWFIASGLVARITGTVASGITKLSLFLVGGPGPWSGTLATMSVKMVRSTVLALLLERGPSVLIMTTRIVIRLSNKRTV